MRARSYSVAVNPKRRARSATFYFKHDAIPDSIKNTISYYATQYIYSMALSMLNDRLGEIVQTANPPFTGASAGYGEFLLNPLTINNCLNCCGACGSA